MNAVIAFLVVVITVGSLDQIILFGVSHPALAVGFCCGTVVVLISIMIDRIFTVK